MRKFVGKMPSDDVTDMYNLDRIEQDVRGAVSESPCILKGLLTSNLDALHIQAADAASLKQLPG